MKRFILAVLFGVISQAAFAADAPNTITGVVTAKNNELRTITVRNDATRQRRVYFVTDSTRMTSRGQPVRLSAIRRGQVVTLTYRGTDLGREVVSAQLPGELIDVPAIDTVGTPVVAGRITGVRPSKRTLTILQDRSRTRMTLTIPEGATIRKEGRVVAMSRLRKGDQIEARYRMTPEGPVFVAAQDIVARPAPEPVAVAQAEPAVVLPKTASYNYAFLAFGLMLMVLGGFVLKSRKAARV